MTQADHPACDLIGSSLKLTVIKQAIVFAMAVSVNGVVVVLWVVLKP